MEPCFGDGQNPVGWFCLGHPLEGCRMAILWVRCHSEEGTEKQGKNCINNYFTGRWRAICELLRRNGCGQAAGNSFAFHSTLFRKTFCWAFFPILYVNRPTVSQPGLQCITSVCAAAGQQEGPEGL